MTIRAAERNVNATVSLLLGVQLVTCFVAIAMLSRLQGAMEQQVEQANRQTALVEALLSRLTVPSSPADAARSSGYVAEAEQLRQAFGKNGIEEGQTVVRDAIPALAGDGAALERSSMALQKLGDKSRTLLLEAQKALEFHSRAAAWVLVLLGITLTVLAAATRGFLHRLFVVPIGELARVIAARAQGDARVRATPLSQGAMLSTTVPALNQILDSLEALEAKAQENAAAKALGAWLDSRTTNAALLTSTGHLVAANQGALDLLASDDGEKWRLALASAVKQPQGAEEICVQPLGADHFLCDFGNSKDQ